MNKIKIFSLIAVFTALFVVFERLNAQDVSKFKCLKTLEGHSERVNSAEFSPDGKYILSVAEDRMIKTRNANNYQLRLVIEKHKRFFISTSFSNEGAVRKRICWDKDHQTLDPFSPNTLKGAVGKGCVRPSVPVVGRELVVHILGLDV